VVPKRTAPDGRIATRSAWATGVVCIREQHTSGALPPGAPRAYRSWDFSSEPRFSYILDDGAGRIPARRSAMAVEVMAATRRRFTRKEYYRMAEAGIRAERERVELIRGEIVEMSPIVDRHAAFVDNLNRLLVRRLPDE